LCGRFEKERDAEVAALHDAAYAHEFPIGVTKHEFAFVRVRGIVAPVDVVNWPDALWCFRVQARHVIADAFDISMDRDCGPGDSIHLIHISILQVFQGLKDGFMAVSLHLLDKFVAVSVSVGEGRRFTLLKRDRLDS